MGALFEIQLESEFLSVQELVQISGCSRRVDQLAWLLAQGWVHHKNRAGVPIVGRLYARLRLAGINAQTLASGGAWTPDFTALATPSAMQTNTAGLRH